MGASAEARVDGVFTSRAAVQRGCLVWSPYAEATPHGDGVSLRPMLGERLGLTDDIQCCAMAVLCLAGRFGEKSSMSPLSQKNNSRSSFVCAGCVSAWRSQGVAPAHRVSLLPYFSLAGAAVPLSAAGSLASA